MTVAAPAPSTLALYHSPDGLYPFQAEAIARAYASPNGAALPILDKGTGKTHVGMALACLLVEDDLVDQVLVVAEVGKVKDFAEDDYPTYTDLRVTEYAGPPARRAKLLTGDPQVLVMSYEVGRNDICTFRPRSRAVAAPGPLTEYLTGRRVLVVFDEVTRLRSRGTKLYKSWDYLVNRVLRRRTGFPVGVPHVRTLGLTASSIRRSPEDHANLCRILAPDLAPSVAEFDRDHVAAYDQFGAPTAFKNLAPGHDNDAGVVPLATRLAPIVTRKRKSDPDVRAQFPAKVENRPTRVELSAQHREFIGAVLDLFPADADEMELRQQFNLVRQIVAHPAALLRGQGRYARQVVEVVGEDGLLAIGSAKVDHLLSWAASLGDAQGVVFTFFGPSVIPLLAPALERAGVSVATNHSGLSSERRQAEKAAFLAGDRQVFVSSDAGARGLNLGCGSALLHYEPALTFDDHDQRSDRIHRLGSRHDSVTVDLLLATGTPDEGAYHLITKRQRWAEQVLDADLPEDQDPAVGVISAATRRQWLAEARGARRPR